MFFFLLERLSVEMYQIRYAKNRGMERHVANFRTLVARYRSLGGTLDDHELTLRFLQSIPTNANYQTVRTLLRTHARTNEGKYDLELAFQYVQETAQDLNEWYPKPDAADPSPAFATSVTTPSSAPNSVRVCYSCGRPGHIQKYCRAARKKQESRTSTPGKDGGGNTKSGPVVGWMTRVVSAKAAYFTGKKSNCVCGNPTCCTPWVLDSAASRHMENLQTSVSVDVPKLANPLQVEVANETLVDVARAGEDTSADEDDQTGEEPPAEHYTDEYHVGEFVELDGCESLVDKSHDIY